MKKEIIACDVCKKESANQICSICGGDVCEDCSLEYEALPLFKVLCICSKCGKEDQINRLADKFFKSRLPKEVIADIDKEWQAFLKETIMLKKL